MKRQPRAAIVFFDSESNPSALDYCISLNQEGFAVIWTKGELTAREAVKKHLLESAFDFPRIFITGCSGGVQWAWTANEIDPGGIIIFITNAPAEKIDGNVRKLGIVRQTPITPGELVQIIKEQISLWERARNLK